MLYFLYLLLIHTTKVTEALTCLTCTGNNFFKCLANAQTKKCNPNSSCQIIMRKREGIVHEVKMGCKQTTACESGRAQNFLGSNSSKFHCKPWHTYRGSYSVCRQCCRDSFDCAKKYAWPNNGKGSYSRVFWGKPTTPEISTELPSMPTKIPHYVPIQRKSGFFEESQPIVFGSEPKSTMSPDGLLLKILTSLSKYASNLKLPAPSTTEATVETTKMSWQDILSRLSADPVADILKTTAETTTTTSSKSFLESLTSGEAKQMPAKFQARSFSNTFGSENDPVVSIQRVAPRTFTRKSGNSIYLNELLRNRRINYKKSKLSQYVNNGGYRTQVSNKKSRGQQNPPRVLKSLLWARRNNLKKSIS